MLEYVQNVDYHIPEQDNLLEDLEELKENLDNYQFWDVVQLYEEIRKQVFREIKLEELAVCIVLNDLHQLRKLKPKTADIIEFYIANNTSSYKEIASEFGCTKQNIHLLIKTYAKVFPWLDNLLKIKGDEDAKNENNRTIFYDPDQEQKQNIVQENIF